MDDKSRNRKLTTHGGITGCTRPPETTGLESVEIGDEKTTWDLK
jgi:hypothetical protein